MKKIVLCLLLASLILTGCNTTSSKETELEKTVESLSKENSKMKTENSELSERVKTFEALFSTTSSSDNQSNNNTTSGNFKIGESARFDSYEVVTVTEVRADDSISLQKPKEGEHPVIVTAIVENSSNEVIRFNAQTFNLYDGNLELATFDASTYGNNIPNEIAGGKKATIVMHFSSKGNAPYSVTYGPATWDE